MKRAKFDGAAAEAEGPHSAKTIVVYNFKGGAAKTTAAANLAGALASGKSLATGKSKVLLVDMDPQCNLGTFFKEDVEDAPVVTEDVDKLKKMLQGTSVAGEPTVRTHMPAENADPSQMSVYWSESSEQDTGPTCLQHFLDAFFEDNDARGAEDICNGTDGAPAVRARAEKELAEKQAELTQPLSAADKDVVNDDIRELSSKLKSTILNNFIHPVNTGGLFSDGDEHYLWMLEGTPFLVQCESKINDAVKDPAASNSVRTIGLFQMMLATLGRRGGFDFIIVDLSPSCSVSLNDSPTNLTYQPATPDFMIYILH